MTVVLLDPRFPSMIPVDAISKLSGDISYTEEVPVRIRWVIADLGGSTVFESEILVTTDLRNELVINRLEEGDELVTAPSLLVQFSPNREIGQAESAQLTAGVPATLPAADSASITADANQSADGDREALLEQYAAAADSASEQALAAAAARSTPQSDDEASTTSSQYSGQAFVEGEVLSADEHTAAVAGDRRVARTEVPSSVMDEIEDAVALMSRALRQGEWEQSMSHMDLLPFLKEETAELSTTVKLRQTLAADEDTLPEWAEQDLCEELSDVLLQVLFHAEIANRRGAFDIGHVAGAFVAKLNARAPYLFEDVERSVEIAEQDQLWAEGKAAEEAKKKETHGPEYSEYLARKKEAEKPDQPAPSPVSQPAPQPSSQSAMTAAEDVIRQARAKGLPDSQIPSSIRYPSLGLELDKPGQAEDRLLKAVQTFRQELDQMG